MNSVLIVDDDHTVINGLLEHIPWADLNLHVQDTAEDGSEALEKIHKQAPDILITDIYMVKMDGLELIKKVQHQFPELTVIIHSGYDDFDNAREAMKYGVKHFLLKPSVVSEFASVLSEVVKERLVKEKQKKISDDYSEQMNAFIPHIRELFFREILESEHQAKNISTEKLNLFNLDANSNTVVLNLTIIRPPYLTKAKEDEWQLNKFATRNIINETIQKTEWAGKMAIYVVDYSESTFLLICMAGAGHVDLAGSSKGLSQKLLDNILMYIELSLIVGIGEVKPSIHHIADSFTESERALEAAEYQEINKVYTYGEVYTEEHTEMFQYPLDMLNDVNSAIRLKELDLIMGKWEKLEFYLLADMNLPVFVTRNICVSIVYGMMMQTYSENHLTEETQNMPTYISEIYGKYSSREITGWMRGFLKEWVQTQRVSGKQNNRLILEVKKYVEDYYCDHELTLKEIADHLFVNRNYLSQLFKRVTSESFVTYLNKYRIEKAKEKLRERNYLVYEISDMTGYQNPAYFSKVFKSITGFSPSDYYQ